ncbi:MAG: hypothetical protein V1810_00205 [Candidatus Beckwithbacteria bacterium]
MESRRVNLFGTSGIRGLASTEITPEFGERLGLALSKWLGKNKVVTLGRDNRPKAAAVSQAVKKGLAAGGVKVRDLGMMPTPELSFHLVRVKADAGIMVTGSHLPIEFLGIIPMNGDGSGIFGQAGEEITKIFYES